MPLRHHVDAAAHVLHHAVGREAHIGRETCLSHLGRHLPGQRDEHVCAPPHRFLDEKHLPAPLVLQTKRPFENLGRMAFLVEVEHQPLQRLQRIGNSPMIVPKGSTMGRPDGQPPLERLVALLDAPAHLGQPRLAPQRLPRLAVGRKNRSTMSAPDASEGRLRSRCCL